MKGVNALSTEIIVLFTSDSSLKEIAELTPY